MKNICINRMGKKLRIQEMQKIAENRNGKCISKEYINSNTKLTWKCVKNHQWVATPNSIKNGTWCPICAIEKKSNTIKEMKILAENRGGECLSMKYINIRNKIKWECKEGHRWEALPSSIKQGHWCPICAIDRKSKTIHDMQILAESKGGKCLSKEYLNLQSKMIWECKEGHRWEAKPANIKQGRWCPLCWIKKKK